MKNIEVFGIDCLGAKVLIYSSVPIKHYLEENSESLDFPGLIIENDVDRKKYGHFLLYRNYERRKIECLPNSIVVSYPYEELSDKNIVYLARYLIEKQFGEENKLTAHASCVAKNGKAILFVGDAGAGKTSLALNLCINSGYELISNDKTVIGMKNGELYAFGGTKYLSLRYKTLEENLPELISLFGSDEIEKWSQKIRIMPREIGIKECSTVSKISDVIFLHLDNRENQLRISKGDTYHRNFKLYENFSESIRVANSTFVDKNGYTIGYVPSYDSEMIFQNRSKIIKYIDEMENYKYLSGNLIEILRYIEGREKEELR